jgi:hypothetical protein
MKPGIHSEFQARTAYMAEGDPVSKANKKGTIIKLKLLNRNKLEMVLLT